MWIKEAFKEFRKEFVMLNGWLVRDMKISIKQDTTPIYPDGLDVCQPYYLGKNYKEEGANIMKQRIYISGPISNNPSYKEDFERACIGVRKVNPEAIIVDPTKICKDVPKDSAWERYMGICISELYTCDIMYVIIKTPCIESKGVELEIEIARALKIKIKYLEYILIENDRDYIVNMQDTYEKYPVDCTHVENQIPCGLGIDSLSMHKDPLIFCPDCGMSHYHILLASNVYLVNKESTVQCRKCGLQTLKMVKLADIIL